MRFELMTSSLPRRRSTPELRGRESCPFTTKIHGAGDEIRTRDPQLGRLMLYQLSYTRPSFPIANFQLITLLPKLIRQSAIANRQSRWCRGEDSNLRRALARRVYSPVPLTTRPPLPDLPSVCGAGEGT